MTTLKQLKENNVLDVHSKILDMFNTKHGVKVGKSSIHSHKNYNNNRTYVVHPVTYSNEASTHGAKKPQEYQNYVHHEQGSSDLKIGLPKRLGGDRVSIE